MATVNIIGDMRFRVLNGFIDKHGVVHAFDGEIEVKLEVITPEEYDNLVANGQIHRDDRTAVGGDN